jgi:hypothetical protein
LKTIPRKAPIKRDKIKMRENHTMVWAEWRISFSPDSKQVAYIGCVGSKRLAVLDGIEGKPYDGFGGGITFSPNSKRVACVMKVGKGWSVIVDGTEGKQYDGIDKQGVIFSPDSNRLAYVAKAGNKWLAVVALHCEEVSDMLLRDFKISQVQVDELWPFVNKNTKIALDRPPQSPVLSPKRTGP